MSRRQRRGPDPRLRPTAAAQWAATYGPAPQRPSLPAYAAPSFTPAGDPLTAWLFGGSAAGGGLPFGAPAGGGFPFGAPAGGGFPFGGVVGSYVPDAFPAAFNPLAGLDDLFKPIGGVGTVLGGIEVAQDIRKGDWGEAAKDAAPLIGAAIAGPAGAAIGYGVSELGDLLGLW